MRLFAAGHAGTTLNKALSSQGVCGSSIDTGLAAAREVTVSPAVCPVAGHARRGRSLSRLGHWLRTPLSECLKQRQPIDKLGVFNPGLRIWKVDIALETLPTAMRS
jgi:hypothetical protein